MISLSTRQQYTVGGVLGSLILFFILAWLILLALSPSKTETVMVKEDVETEYPEPEPVHRVDPYREARQTATASGLDPNMVVALIRSEGLLNRAEEFEGACDIREMDCIVDLAEKQKHLAAALNRKPTPADMLLAHTFGVPEAIRFYRMPGDKPIKEINEKILKANSGLEVHETVADFRIWLSRAVYRLMVRR